MKEGKGGRMKLKDKILKDFEEKFKYNIRRHYAFVMAENGKAFVHWGVRKTPCEDDYIKAISKEATKALDSMREETLREVEKEAIIDGKITNKKAVSAINRVMIYLINNLKTI